MDRPANNDRVTGFSQDPMYKRCLRFCEKDIGAHGAIENLDLLTKECNISSSAIRIIQEKSFYIDSGDYEEIYTTAKMSTYFGMSDDVVTVEIKKYNENSCIFEEIKEEFETVKRICNFENILDVHYYMDSPLMEDIKTYLAFLFEMNYNLVINNKVINNIKEISVWKENILITIRIDFDAMSQVFEEIAMVSFIES